MGDNWTTLAKRFSDNFEVHVVDQRNHGKSFHYDSWTYLDMVNDLEEYINHYNLKDISLLGHSMGGKTAMFFSCMNPKLVKKLVIADMAPREYPVRHFQILDAMDSLDFDVISSRKEADNKLAESITDMGIRQFVLKGLHWKEKGKLAFRFNLDVIKNNIDNVVVSLPPNAFYNGDVLFLDAENSDYISQDDVDDIDFHFPNNEIIEIKNAGHWLHAEQPEVFYSLVVDFIGV